MLFLFLLKHNNMFFFKNIQPKPDNVDEELNGNKCIDYVMI